jgi:hypothetical protein
MKAQPLLLPALKRRRGPRVAVLALVLCSLLVPLAFLFDRAPSGTSTLRYAYPSPFASSHCALGWERGARRARITASPPSGSGALVLSSGCPPVRLPRARAD